MYEDSKIFSCTKDLRTSSAEGHPNDVLCVQKHRYIHEEGQMKEHNAGKH